MALFFKRKWDETTGEELTDKWGTSIYYFETDDELNVIKQMEVFEAGQVLKYDMSYTSDQFGMLADQKLDSEDFEEYAITENEFLATWNKLSRKTD